MHTPCRFPAPASSGFLAGLVALLFLSMALAMPASAAPPDVGWPEHGLTPDEQRFSPLTQVNAANVGSLGVDWYFDVPSIDDGLAATPIVVDGVIYMTSSFANVFAVDARTGKQRWHFDPGVKVHSSFSNSWAARVNRGVAVAGDLVFVGTPDCRLIAIDRASGKSRWDVVTCDPALEYSITGAPRIAGDMVVMGNGISDYGARGYISAYDRQTGAMKWRFYTVPGDPAKAPPENPAMAMAAKTWAEGWAKSGGASPWDAIVYDAELGQIYFGTDSAIPYDPSVRSPGGGDNLFTNSIVALDAKTGEYRWHYQTVPNDAWDYNAASHIILAELEMAGSRHKVLMQAPKNGFFYVIERRTGKLLAAEPYVPVTWAKRIDLATGRPVEAEGARYYLNESRSADLVPSLIGGHNWHPMSFSPKTGLVYIPAHAFSTTYRVNPDAALGGVMFDWYGSDPDAKRTDLDAKSVAKVGKLIAWDPVQGRERWHVDHELPMNGGVLATAGNLVFQGTATGQFNAFAADTGKLLWSRDMHASMQSPPVTYQVDGRQVVLIPVGGGGIARFMIPLYGTGRDALGPSRLVAFSLSGKQELPAYEYQEPPVPMPPPETPAPALVKKGADLFEVAACGLCHGSLAVGRRPPYTSVPDLRYLSAETHRDFRKIVLEGQRRDMGMIPYTGLLTDEDVEALHAFVVDRQRELYERQQSGADGR